MKKNCKGFVLLETLIVSTFILGTLVFLYVEFSAVKRSYDISFRYNTVPGLYYAKEMTSYLKEIGYSNLEPIMENNNYIDITSCEYFDLMCSNIVKHIGAKKVIYVGNKLNNLKSSLQGNYDKGVFDGELKKFILQLSDETTDRKRIIIEFNDSTFATIHLGLEKNEGETNEK